MREAELFSRNFSLKKREQWGCWRGVGWVRWWPKMPPLDEGEFEYLLFAWFPRLERGSEISNSNRCERASPDAGNQTNTTATKASAERRENFLPFSPSRHRLTLRGKRPLRVCSCTWVCVCAWVRMCLCWRVVPLWACACERVSAAAMVVPAGDCSDSLPRMVNTIAVSSLFPSLPLSSPPLLFSLSLEILYRVLFF